MNEVSTLNIEDMLAFLKTLNISLIQKRQYSNDLIIAFLKRLSLLALHSPVYLQCGILLFIKKVLTKYPNAKGVIDFNAISTNEVATKEDERIITNEDPQLLTTVHQLSIYHEMVSLAQSSYNKTVLGLVRSILEEKSLPDSLINTSPLEICKSMYITSSK